MRNCRDCSTQACFNPRLLRLGPDKSPMCSLIRRKCVRSNLRKEEIVNNLHEPDEANHCPGGSNMSKEYEKHKHLFTPMAKLCQNCICRVAAGYHLTHRLVQLH